MLTMKYKSFDHMNCSLAQTLDILGERWTLLILRDAFFGVRRFGHFQRNLGIAKNILSTRLNRLVEEGILEKCDLPECAHAEYRLTPAGRDLQPILLAMVHWGDRHRPNPQGARLIFVDRESGRPIRPMSAVSAEGRPLAAEEVRAVPGPAADSAVLEPAVQSAAGDT